MIKNNIEFLTKGCSYSKGCKTLRCGCKKRQRNCGPGCLCQGCTNISTPEALENSRDSESDEDSESSYPESEGEEDSEPLEEEIIMDDLFFNTYDIA